MKYCRYRSATGATQYALVEERDGALWAIAPMDPPAEDLAARLQTKLADTFAPAPLSALDLLAPVTPSKIVCVGRNYKEHAAELGNEVPREPLLFLKPPSSLLAPRRHRQDARALQTHRLRGRTRHRHRPTLLAPRPAEDPLDYIRGYTIVNDVTARDIQKSDGQWTRGKGWDTFCPTGPIVSDEIDPLDGDPVIVTTRLNGQVKQHGSTADLIFPIDFLLRYISASITLEPGDLIPTGTPSGVGPVQPGDTVEVEVTGLGILSNRFASET